MMTVAQKRSQLSTLTSHVLEEDLDLLLRVVWDFAARGLNAEHRKHQLSSLQDEKEAST